jgi:antagonist of KipI
MSLTITRAGIYDSIQDSGRYGYRYLGINCGGAMDGHSMAMANALVGNPAGMAVLEMHFPAPEITCNNEALLVICGADFSATVDDVPLIPGQPVRVVKGCRIRFSKWIYGARVYLAVNGGFLIPEWLGSTSTDLQAGKGGWQGRLLQENDEIPFAGSKWLGSRQPTTSIKLPWFATMPGPLRLFKLLPGRQWQLLDKAAKAIMEQNEFTITGRANRMGMFLQGTPITLEGSGDMLSVPVSFGTMQLLPGGQIVILGADHQATGGYPVIAHVVSAQLGNLGQLNTGDCIRFDWCTSEEALQLFATQQQDLLQVKNACNLKLDQWILK